VKPKGSLSAIEYKTRFNHFQHSPFQMWLTLLC